MRSSGIVHCVPRRWSSVKLRPQLVLPASGHTILSVMNRSPVVDMWAPILPLPEVMEWIAEHFPPQMLGYLRVFWKREPTLTAVREGAREMALPEEAVFAALDAAGITRS